MNKQQLLRELSQEIFAALQPSPVHGIGVFALRPIPKGCKNIFSHETGEWILLSMEEVERLPPHSRNFVETYYLYDDDHYFIPSHGCKVMDMANYLNHSATPNIRSVDDGRYFETIREIQAGEELLIDYGSIVEGVGDYD